MSAWNFKPMDYILHLIILAAVGAMVALSLDIVAGQMGLLSTAQAAMVGMGGYGSVILASRLGLPLELALVGGVVSAILGGLVVGLASLRTHEDYFAIATLGLQLIAIQLLNNLGMLTGGPLGIASASSRGWLVLPDSPLVLPCLSVALVGLLLWLHTRLTRAPTGRVWRAIREDEILTASLGRNVPRVKVIAVAVAAGEAGLAGGILAAHIGFIDPTTFGVNQSILFLAMVILGGAGRPAGAVLGALVLVLFPEGLRFVGLDIASASRVRELLFGLLLVFLMRLRPQGLLGTFSFEPRRGSW